MLVVGLTGGIASGKTTVSNLFAECGITIVDADVIGRRMLDPDQPGYAAVVERLGTEVLDANQSIDRQQLRQCVFNQPELKQWLEEILHPLIYQACAKELSAAGSDGYALLVVPLMFETGFHQLADRFCVIDCPAEIQIERLTRRDRIDPELAKKMIASQMSNESRLARADDVISNTGSLQEVRVQVQQLHAKYTRLATGDSG